MANPLDQFKKNTTAESIRVPEVPGLQELVKVNGLVPGMKLFDEEMSRWRIDLERNINERFAAQSVTTPAATKATT
jgi:hypothetical protein